MHVSAQMSEDGNKLTLLLRFEVLGLDPSALVREAHAQHHPASALQRLDQSWPVPGWAGEQGGGLGSPYNSPCCQQDD